MLSWAVRRQLRKGRKERNSCGKKNKQVDAQGILNRGSCPAQPAVAHGKHETNAQHAHDAPKRNNVKEVPSPPAPSSSHLTVPFQSWGVKQGTKTPNSQSKTPPSYKRACLGEGKTRSLDTTRKAWRPKKMVSFQNLLVNLVVICSNSEQRKNWTSFDDLAPAVAVK